MSIEAMAVALHHSKTQGATKLVLLGIANHEGDGGRSRQFLPYANTQVG